MKKRHLITTRSSEKGSAFFYIFIAIALFAALSFTVAQMNRSGTGDVNKELYDVYATDILQYSNSILRAVQQMRVEGVSDTEISFENDIDTNYTNPNCTTDDCKIFHPNGGGMLFQAPDEKWSDGTNTLEWLFTGDSCVRGVGTGAAGACASPTSQLDLLLVLTNVKEEICERLNIKAGLGETIPQDGSSAFSADPHFVGIYGPGVNLSDGADLIRQRNACFEGGGTPAAGTFHFYQVLIAR